MTHKRDDHEKKTHKGDQPEEEMQAQELAEEEEVGPDKLASDIAQMQEELSKLQKDAEESHDKYLRTLADFDNYRKRQREDTSRMINQAKEDLLLMLLPIVDNFERTLQSAESQHNYEALVEGVSLTLRQVMEMLDKVGVKPIEAVGQQFDPELHEALMRCEPEEECPDNTIVEEFEKGYTINDKVLRPARVKVAVSD